MNEIQPGTFQQVIDVLLFVGYAALFIFLQRSTFRNDDKNKLPETEIG